MANVTEGDFAHTLISPSHLPCPTRMAVGLSGPCSFFWACLTSGLTLLACGLAPPPTMERPPVCGHANTVAWDPARGCGPPRLESPPCPVRLTQTHLSSLPSSLFSPSYPLFHLEHIGCVTLSRSIDIFELHFPPPLQLDHLKDQMGGSRNES